jgi:hypothetical protein
MNQEEKARLLEIVSQWTTLDDEMSVLKKELNKRRRDKKEVSLQLIELMKIRNTGEYTIQGDRIQYIEHHVKKPITSQILVQSMLQFFDGDAEKTEALKELIDENRPVVVREDIRRKVKKE